MEPDVPALSSEERIRARAIALEVRRRRADVKQQLRDGVIDLDDVLDLARGDDVVAHIRVMDILRCLPRIGEVRATGIMEQLGIAPNRRLRGLGDNQRSGLRREASRAWR
ncbi:integration host factor, actinobacterial type [Propioniferax innocua]|uniref:Integration host factor-like helix-two turn-helix domain-containing protein n=1 Tax=Propioniferax innocua TaxID=1753 RepID=A0A542ZPQ1_9ACTN|nr:integration host factor, actinobacterial type [Propioniferax innocua]TQL62307.1 hypothetical protein FB460_0078 [Propioniferax innocua]